MIAAGLLAKKAVEKGLTTKPWVKASLAPGSKVVTDYLKDAGPRRRTSTSSGSTSSATAARPASATRARSRPRSPRRSTTTTSSPPPCSQRQPQLRGPDQLRRPGQLPRLARRWSSPTPWPARWTSTCSTTRSATTRTASPSSSRTSGRPRARSRTRSCKSVRAEMFHKEYGEVFEGDERWNSLPVPHGRPLRVGRQLDLRQEPALLRGHARPAPAGRRDQGGPGAGGAGRQHHDRPHLAGRLDQGAGPRGQVPDRARRRRRRLQLLRLAARQPRGDGPGHVRQHPAPEQARPRHRGGRHPPPARRRGDDDLRRLGALPARRASR